MKIYDIINQIKEIEQKIDQFSEDNLGFVPDELMKELEGSELKFEEKLEQFIKILMNKKSFSDVLKEEKRKIDSKLKANERAIENLKFFIGSIVGIDNKYTVGQFKISWRKSESLEVLDESKVPDTFCKFEKKVNKNDLKDYVKSGGEVDGVRISEKKNIQIK
jgi:hypothetical protein